MNIWNKRQFFWILVFAIFVKISQTFASHIIFVDDDDEISSCQHGVTGKNLVFHKHIQLIEAHLAQDQETLTLKLKEAEPFRVLWMYSIHWPSKTLDPHSKETLELYHTCVRIPL